MSLNWKEIDLLIDELALEGALIQQTTQRDYSSVILHLHHKRESFRILLCCKRDFVRITRTESGGERQFSNQRFNQLLRSKIRNGRIIDVQQIHSQRIVEFEIAIGGTVCYLYVRLWNNGANIILCNSDYQIIDALYRRPGRNEISGALYNPKLEYRETIPKEGVSIRDIPENSTFHDHIMQYYCHKEEQDSYIHAYNRTLQTIQRMKDRYGSALHDKRHSISKMEDPDLYRKYGNLVLCNIHKWTMGCEQLAVTDYSDNDPCLVIPLDPSLNAQDNSQSYFKKARQAESARTWIEQDIERLEQQLELLETWQAELENTETAKELRAIENAILQLIPRSRSATARKQGEPGLRFLSSGFSVLVGRNAAENDSLLRSYVKGNDWWFHVRDIPGGYVFVRNIRRKSLPLEVQLDAAALAVHFSKADTNGHNIVQCTQVKNLRRVKGGKKGLVIPYHEKTIVASAMEKRLNRLLGRSTLKEE